jgi:hypothetical protein
MKKLKLFFLALVASSLAVASCNNDIESALQEEPKSLDPKEEALGPWLKQFDDQFSAGSNLGNWEKTNRADYNSSACIYQSTNPKIATLDNASCLLLTAKKNGSVYNSGHVKSNYSFKPANNEEYRVYARIKLIAKEGATFRGFNQTYGAWPAFWTVQETAWPTKGEMDIMEGYSFNGSSRFASNLFYGTTYLQNLLGNTAEKRYSVTEGWHNYNLFWSNRNGINSMIVKLDGVTVATYTNDVNPNLKLQNFGPHNIIFNLNVGSNSSIGIFDSNLINLFTTTEMYIDWVQVDKRTL